MTYRDDVDALFARVQSLQAEVNRLRAERDAAPADKPDKPDKSRARPETSPLAASQQKTTAWVAPLIARLPAAEQELVADLVMLFTTRKDYPALSSVSEESLDQLVTRLRASFKKP